MIQIKALGAVPLVAQIAASIAMKMAAGGLNNMMATRQTAQEYIDMKDMDEAQFHELATLLSRRTEYGEDEWFTTLINMKKWGMLEPENGSTVPTPDLTKITPSWMNWAIGVGLVVALIVVFKK